MFHDLQTQIDPATITNLITIGDSMYEVEAAKSVGMSFPQVVVKTIKFKECPTPEELLKQLQLAESQLEQLVASGSGVSVVVEQRSAKNPKHDRGTSMGGG